MNDFEKIIDGFISEKQSIATTITLTRNQVEYIDNLCKQTGLSRTKVIQAIIDEHIKRSENE